MKLRFLTGAIIASHGLYRIVFIEEYTDFIYDNFSQIIPFETLLMVGSAIFPFLEFCSPGYYSPDGLAICSACPVGTYQDQYQSTNCTRCPTDTTTLSTNRSSASDCQS